MNVLLLGNGFDLTHKLPTKYINFLNTTNFLLRKSDLNSIKTIGDVFGDTELQKIDKGISESFNAYQFEYYKTPIDLNELKNIVSLTKNNMWFSYFSKSFNNDLGWIDFEKEISFVVNIFQQIFSQEDKYVIIPNKNNNFLYLLNHFGFFIDNSPEKIPTVGMKRISKDYLIETPIGSNYWIANKEKIINRLSFELEKVSEALKLYLSCFVDKALENIREKMFFWSNTFTYVNDVVTFNYTNTFEKLYNKKSTVYHLHGNTNNKIVLGINPDLSDKIETIDTSFIFFKKYFQRVKYRTDNKYIEFIKEFKETYGDLNLYVIGHSLDITDKDIIEQLFALANEIIVLHYSEEDELQHISNIVKIFGKERFDELRSENNLSFLPINTNLTDKMKENYEPYFGAQVITY